LPLGRDFFRPCRGSGAAGADFPTAPDRKHRDRLHGLRSFSRLFTGYDNGQAGSKKFLTSDNRLANIDVSPGILPVLGASRILPPREDKIPRGKLVTADGVRPRMPGQEIDLVSFPLSGNGSTAKGWEKRPLSHQAAKVENPNFRQVWRLTNLPTTLRNGAMTLRDVKNEDRPGYVHENKDDYDKMSGEKHGSYTKMHPLRDNRQQSKGLLGRNAQFAP
jgi:hypothetical protein